MLIKFSSEQSADFIMMDNAADQLLSMMGYGGSTEGSVSGEALNSALSSLTSRIESEPDAPTNDNVDKNADTGDWDEDEAGEEPEPVTVSARAAPLVNMLRKAKNADGYVMWRPD
jgi:hypothetical protein